MMCSDPLSSCASAFERDRPGPCRRLGGLFFTQNNRVARLRIGEQWTVFFGKKTVYQYLNSYRAPDLIYDEGPKTLVAPLVSLSSNVSVTAWWLGVTRHICFCLWRFIDPSQWLQLFTPKIWTRFSLCPRRRGGKKRECLEPYDYDRGLLENEFQNKNASSIELSHVFILVSIRCFNIRRRIA
jgi:hypothetical protein